MKLAHDRVQW